MGLGALLWAFAKPVRAIVKRAIQLKCVDACTVIGLAKLFHLTCRGLSVRAEEDALLHSRMAQPGTGPAPNAPLL